MSMSTALVENGREKWFARVHNPSRSATVLLGQSCQKSNIFLRTKHPTVDRVEGSASFWLAVRNIQAIMFLHLILPLFLLFVTPLRSLPIEDQLAPKELEERHGLDLGASSLLSTRLRIPVFSEFQLTNILKWKAQAEAMGFPWSTHFTIIRMGGGSGGSTTTATTTPTEEYGSGSSGASVPGASGSSTPVQYEMTGTNMTGTSSSGTSTTGEMPGTSATEEMPGTSSQACSGPGSYGSASGRQTDCQARQGYASTSSSS
ncbi:MAG: hypothetical protein Q9167_003342 [Letrouitia subvulpina]